MIKNRYYLTYIITAALWVLVFIIFIVSKQLILMTGTEVILQPRPVDPRDLFRGEYVTIGYDISSIDITKYGYIQGDFDYDQSIYVLLTPDAQGVYRLYNISPVKPETGIFLKGKVISPYNSIIRVEYGIESYFVEKNTAYLIENRMRDNLLIKIVVDKNGKGIIKEFI